MNYVELHIGDYEKGTSHLTACEDGIYGRLLRRYYDTEAALPVDLKVLQRLVRARTKDEKEAVETILEEFFQRQEDGWRHGRCDEEIAKYQAKRAKAKRSADVRWGNREQDQEDMRTHSDSDANASETHNGRNAHHTPVTSPQSPVGKGEAHTDDWLRAEIARACVLMRKAGCPRTNPGHVDLRGAIAEGVTPEVLEWLVPDAVKSGKTNPFAYVITTARAQRQQGINIIPGVTHSNGSPAGKLCAVDQIVANIARRRKLEGDLDDDDADRSVVATIVG